MDAQTTRERPALNGADPDAKPKVLQSPAGPEDQPIANGALAVTSETAALAALGLEGYQEGDELRAWPANGDGSAERPDGRDHAADDDSHSSPQPAPSRLATAASISTPGNAGEGLGVQPDACLASVTADSSAVKHLAAMDEANVLGQEAGDPVAHSAVPAADIGVTGPALTMPPLHIDVQPATVTSDSSAADAKVASPGFMDNAGYGKSPVSPSPPTSDGFVVRKVTTVRKVGQSTVRSIVDANGQMLATIIEAMGPALAPSQAASESKADTSTTADTSLDSTIPLPVEAAEAVSVELPPSPTLNVMSSGDGPAAPEEHSATSAGQAVLAVTTAAVATSSSTSVITEAPSGPGSEAAPFVPTSTPASRRASSTPSRDETTQTKPVLPGQPVAATPGASDSGGPGAAVVVRRTATLTPEAANTAANRRVSWAVESGSHDSGGSALATTWPRPSAAANKPLASSISDPTDHTGMPLSDGDSDSRSRLASALRRRSSVNTGETAQPKLGTSVDVNHPNYELMHDMLSGIRVSGDHMRWDLAKLAVGMAQSIAFQVSRCQAKEDRELIPNDFTAAHKLAFDITGGELQPSSKYDFKFKDYAPWVFRRIREHFRMDAADYLMTLTNRYVLSELGSPGKSGSFFYFSSDFRLIIKTIAATEHRFFRTILQRYYHYILQEPNTLLVRFYGLHRVKLPRGRKIHFVVMENVFPPNRDMHETYDLKGSLVGRYTQPNPEKTSILKDNNFLQNKRYILLGPEKRALFLKQLKRDSDFLASLNIMDYSLLLGIHNMDRGNRDKLQQRALSVVEHVPGVRGHINDVVSESEKKAIRRGIRREITGAHPVALDQASMGLPEMAPEDDGLEVAADDAWRGIFGLADRHDSRRKICLFYRDDGGFRATDEFNQPRHELYHMGIIDILTAYNWKKRAEHRFKALTSDAATVTLSGADAIAGGLTTALPETLGATTEPSIIVTEEPAAGAAAVHTPPELVAAPDSVATLPNESNRRREEQVDPPKEAAPVPHSQVLVSVEAVVATTSVEPLGAIPGPSTGPALDSGPESHASGATAAASAFSGPGAPSQPRVEEVSAGADGQILVEPVKELTGVDRQEVSAEATSNGDGAAVSQEEPMQGRIDSTSNEGAVAVELTTATLSG